MAEPRVGIGVPVYNGANYLRETLQNLADQTFTDFQVLVSDNGSTDGTHDILAEFADKDERFRYRIHPENIGAHRNYNSLVPHLTNEYFKWVAHDDLIAPDFLERCVAALDAEPDAVLAFTATHRIDEDGNVVETLHSTKTYDFDEPSARLRAYIGDRLKAPPIFGVMRRSVLGKTALLRNYHAADFTFLQELAMWGRFTYIEDPLFMFRLHSEQHSAAPTQQTASFFNPNQRAPMMSNWLAWGGMVDSIRRVPMSPAEKLRCLGFAGYWAVRHAGDFGSDLASRAKYETGRIAHRIRR